MPPGRIQKRQKRQLHEFMRFKYIPERIYGVLSSPKVFATLVRFTNGKNDANNKASACKPMRKVADGLQKHDGTRLTGSEKAFSKTVLRCTAFCSQGSCDFSTGQLCGCHKTGFVQCVRRRHKKMVSKYNSSKPKKHKLQNEK